ncbi:hypothetical protein [Sphingobacterium mizutaii]|uniref:hypothetical protein n=1 Tax=Sphingobacterium mizutaii TaxID=1010 RepID=UPI001625BA5C|nr:hypothetical protein [Sphingobacterium mizutaii]
MGILKLKQALRTLRIEELDYSVEQVIKKLRDNTPLDETALAKTIFKVHFMEENEKKRVEVLFNTFQKYAEKWNATKVLDEIKKQRMKLNIT